MNMRTRISTPTGQQERKQQKEKIQDAPGTAIKRRAGENRQIYGVVGQGTNPPVERIPVQTFSKQQWGLGISQQNQSQGNQGGAAQGGVPHHQNYQIPPPGLTSTTAQVSQSDPGLLTNQNPSSEHTGQTVMQETPMGGSIQQAWVSQGTPNSTINIHKDHHQ